MRPLTLAATLASAALFAAPAALAANPTAVLDKGFVEYTGVGPVGNNGLQDSANFYWFFEGTGTWEGQAVNSWFLIWDAASAATVSGSVSFDAPILFRHDTRAELIATAAFNKPGVTYDYSNPQVGLEGEDRPGTSVVGNVLNLVWTSTNPGDHVRVMTAVPEPGTYALMAMGLLAMGLRLNRARRSQTLDGAHATLG
jgi:hypothetical protein